MESSRSATPDTAAFNAVMTVPDSDPSEYREFLFFLDENKLTATGRIQGHPVYRLNDVSDENACYLIDERSALPESKVSSVEFAVKGDFLILKYGLETSADESFVVSNEIINLVTEKLGLKSLTRAELAIASQLLCGMTMQEAAESDDLSVETKRSQIKSIMSKLEVTRQIDLIRILLSELLLLVDVRNWDQVQQNLFNEYVDSFLPDRVRCQRLVDRNGKSVRIVDFGPQRGKPVIVLHSMIFPDITDEDVDFAYENNLRLIWPLRPGLLETTPVPKSVELYSKEILQGIELAWEQFCGEPVPVLAMVSSAWHAVEFAQKHADKVSEITFAATCFSAGKYENNIAYFGSSVAELCSRNTWLMTRTVDFLQKRVDAIEIFEKTITRVFSQSGPDVAVLKREFEAPYYGRRLKMVFVDSPESVKHDYFNQVHFSWSTVSKLTVPVTFIHGEQDSMHKIKDLQRLTAAVGDVRLVAMEETGHLMQYGHFHSLLRRALHCN